MPSRRRTTTPVRRPRVAGLAPDGSRTDADGVTVTEPRPSGVEPRADDERAPRSRAHTAAPAADDTAAPAADDTAAPVVDDTAAPVVDDTVAATPVADQARPSEVDEAAPGTERTGTEPDAVAEPGTTAKPVGRAGRRRPAEASPTAATDDAPGPRPRTVPVLVGVLAVLVALAVFFGVATLALRGGPATANTALTDVGTTSEVASQLGDALEIVYSYDFARLDENERAAREVITTGFSAEFDRLFAQVRELAPQQQAVVSATIAVSAVQQIDGDRAVLVAFMDQQATTVANAEQAAAAGRLTVVGERVDGRWKIASVESR